MRTIFRTFAYLCKIHLSDLGFTFWVILYPLIMASFFYLGFHNLQQNQFEPIPVAVVQDGYISDILKDIDILEVKEVLTEEAAMELLEEKNVAGFIHPDLSVTVMDDSTLESSMIYQVVTTMVQSFELGEDASRLDFSKQHIASENQASNLLVIAFYTLLASVSFYSMFGGISLITSLQANLSSIGSRISMVPVSRRTFLFMTFVVSLLLNTLANGILIAYIYFVFSVSLFQYWGWSLLLLFIANVFGTAMGMLIGGVGSYTENTKITIALIINLVLSALAGMMGMSIRQVVREYLPFFHKINPMAIITDTLYQMNQLHDISTLSYALFVLLGYSILGLGLAILYLRKEKYDAI